ncbi:rhodanese-like domain-containing protein [Nocardioides sp. GXZ039]|uniref:rhodanese-like domain-containing protein n=1 Tax=Nocardioides sp. GXZ039 TaxID=3136018 RepID=UPI0030F43846
MPVLTIDVPALGNRCHLVHDGRVAIVVDAPRDLTAVEAAAEAAELEIVAVADTHIHNDYVSGALGLARRHGADYLLSADESVDFERVGVHDRDRLSYGSIDLEVLSTPGHTRHHQSFLARIGAEAPALLSGGSLLVDTVGRTDLVDHRLAGMLAGSQWESARRLGALSPSTVLLPTHGFGSFCSSASVDPDAADGVATIGAQLLRNPALLQDKETFVNDLLAGLGPIPSYYQHMDPLNRAGRGAVTPPPARPVTADEVSDAILGGAWVIDLRSRDDFAAGHVAGTVSVEYSHQFATYVGWLVPWGDDIVLLTDSADVLDPALRQLADIGIDRVDAHVVDADAPLTARYRRADWAAFRDAARIGSATGRPPVVIDVRQLDEWRAGHLAGALHIPIQDVEASVRRLPPGELWVHCRSGYRAGIAASLLHRAGRDVVHLDDAWDRVGDLRIETFSTAA